MEEKTPIRFRTIIEILGKPKDHVEQTFSKYIEQLKKEDSFSVLAEEYSEIKEQGNLFSKFAELEMIAKDVPSLVGFCFDYMPSSIEIVKPEKIFFTHNEASNLFNDLQARLHRVDMVVKQLRAENNFIKKNMKNAIANLIKILLKVRPMEIAELSKLSGILEKELIIYLDELIKNNNIKKEGNVYNL